MHISNGEANGSKSAQVSQNWVWGLQGLSCRLPIFVESSPCIIMI